MWYLSLQGEINPIQASLSIIIHFVLYPHTKFFLRKENSKYYKCLIPSCISKMNQYPLVEIIKTANKKFLLPDISTQKISTGLHQGNNHFFSLKYLGKKSFILKVIWKIKVLRASFILVMISDFKQKKG